MSTLPKAPREVPPINDMQVLAPGFRRRLERCLDMMRDRRHDPIVFETLRTDERQIFLYGFGRRYVDASRQKPVTHSQDADETWHGYGLAADVISKSMGWNAPQMFWLDLMDCARICGLLSGADWNNNGRSDDESFVDAPHLQFGDNMRRSPSARALRLRETGGFQAVWEEVGAAA